MNRTAKDPSKITNPGRYGFGKGLWLAVTPTGSKAWSYRYSFNGHARQMGLGGYPLIDLEHARVAATAARKLARSGTDPIEARRDEAKGHKGRAIAFREVAHALIADLRHKWRSPKSEQQWTSSLAAYAYPKIGDKDVASITKTDVAAILRPIWITKPETAKRVRARIEMILARATALDLRHGENPASLSLLRHLLPSAPKKTRHHAAMPYAQVPALVRQLRTVEDVAARALEFTILTAARSEEALGARWSEIDLRTKMWAVPANRMKANVPHVVPLSSDAMALLMSLPRDADYVFTGGNGRRLAADSLRKILRQLGCAATVHGFRSSFRDWASEMTAHEQTTCELALAHTVGSKVETAYHRTKLIEKRRLLMSDWSDFCAGAGAAIKAA